MEAVVHTGDWLKELQLRRVTTQPELPKAASVAKNTIGMEHYRTDAHPLTLGELAYRRSRRPLECICKVDFRTSRRSARRAVGAKSSPEIGVWNEGN